MPTSHNAGPAIRGRPHPPGSPSHLCDGVGLRAGTKWRSRRRSRRNADRRRDFTAVKIKYSIWTIVRLQAMGARSRLVAPAWAACFRRRSS